MVSSPASTFSPFKIQSSSVDRSISLNPSRETTLFPLTFIPTLLGRLFPRISCISITLSTMPVRTHGCLFFFPCAD